MTDTTPSCRTPGSLKDDPVWQAAMDWLLQRNANPDDVLLQHAHARWLARSAACEMHGGFTALRTACSTGPDHWMVGPSRAPAPDHPGLAKDLRRIVELWRSLRERFGAGGPYLFGDWSVPDAFFTPVAARIRHFQLDLAAHGDDGTARAYAETLLAHPHFREWEADALGLTRDNHPG